MPSRHGAGRSGALGAGRAARSRSSSARTLDRPRAPARLRPDGRRRARARRRRSGFTATSPGRFEIELEDRGLQIARARGPAPDARRARDRRRPRPAGPGLALLLGRRRRARPLVRRARRALEAAAARAARGRAAAARRARARPPLDGAARPARRRLGRAARARLPDRAARRAVVGGEPRADVHLRDLLARPRARAGRCSGTSGRCSTRGARSRRRRVDLARLGQDWTPPLAATRSGSGVWPAAFLLFCFAALELAYAEPGEPARARARDRALQLRHVVRDGRLRPAGLGRARRGFTVYFGLLARIAPFGERDGRLVVRVPVRRARGPGRDAGHRSRSSPSCSARSASTGSAATPFWQNLRAESRGRTSSTRRGTRELLVDRRSRSPGCSAASSLVALAYLGAIGSRGDMVEPERSLAPEFVLSLVPIALVYAVAHYFTLLVIQGQYAIPLASDPFGFGWDLFGTADYAPNIAPFSPEHRLVRPGRRARRRPRRRPRGRARPRGDDLRRTRRAPLAVRHAGADGRSTPSAGCGCSRGAESPTGASAARSSRAARRRDRRRSSSPSGCASGARAADDDGI